jgi:CubicO group peptidase (beta-lactamase class C family)
VRDGALDVEDTLARWLPELPAWAGAVRLRNLLYHTAAVPDMEVSAIVGDGDLTTAAVLSALARVPDLAGRPGTAHAYSNTGYVCLAEAVQRAAGQPLPEFAEQRIFMPLGMSSTCCWTGPAPMPPDAAPLAVAHPAPLALGAGGVWSTARDLLRWSQALNGGELGISRLMEAPGSLDDGTPVGYAWGMGVRVHGGYRVCRHGGGWPGLRALLARVPDLNQSLVILALADDSERRLDLAASMLDLVTACPAPLPASCQTIVPSGCSRRVVNAASQRAARAPSIARWSTDRVQRMTVPRVTAPSAATGCCFAAPTAMMPDCGGLMIAENSSVPYMPRFETENVPPSSSSWRSRRSRARPARS